MPLPLRSSCLAGLVLALAAATGVHAAELGDASVRSTSGQPLSADIELTDLTAQELADLQVRLARPDVFQGANVTMNPALAGARIAIARRDSRRILQVSTSAPVQGEILHLYFQLVSGGKERVRGVTLWLPPAPTPAVVPGPAPAPAAVAAAPAQAALAVASRPAQSNGRLVAIASPGKEATAGERELLGAVERAIAARGGKVESGAPAKAAPASSKQEVRKEALKYASTADDFKRHAKPAKPAKPAVVEKDAEPVMARQEQSAEPESKASQRSFLPSRSALAEAARATRASVEAGAQPAAPQKAAKAVETVQHTGGDAQAAGGAADPAMLDKLAQLEGKLKMLQAQLAMSNQAGAARVTAPVPGHADTASVAAPFAQPAAAAPKTPDAAMVAAATAFASASAPAPAPASAPVSAPVTTPETAPHAESVGETAPAPAEPPKAKPEEKKEAAPPPPEPKKEIKISRPKLLTFLFAGSLVLLGIFCVIVHFVRKAKLKRSPIVRQSWSRDDDDAPARVEPALAPAPQPESRAA